jgi:hypothetical protein
LQQAEPSSGWAQQAPSFSFSFLLGVQQADPLEGCEQQEDVDAVVAGATSLLF